MSRYSLNTRLGRILDDAAARDIPETIDLWPAIASTVQSRSARTPGNVNTADPRAWTEPALTRHRPARESEEQPSMTSSTDTPISLPQRRWSKELWKIAAAILVFAV